MGPWAGCGLRPTRRFAPYQKSRALCGGEARPLIPGPPGRPGLFHSPRASGGVTAFGLALRGSSGGCSSQRVPYGVLALRGRLYLCRGPGFSPAVAPLSLREALGLPAFGAAESGVSPRLKGRDSWGPSGPGRLFALTALPGRASPTVRPLRALCPPLAEWSFADGFISCGGRLVPKGTTR